MPFNMTCCAGVMKNGVFAIIVKCMVGWNTKEFPGTVN